ncbi:MAG: hypothetical protein Harvfovirus62_6 [Harvfovirus sp.]|uniref:Uncharacterized protein n=1 Tax=Harvfovirus sp. TaxID=2487768 RepID=A0A3G5A7H5_9VIRU|nr:MAG: hypothetical protein Harvfovirus62_6 [Harvfovirus sp.]
MSKSKSKSESGQYVCFVWEGYLKRTTVRFFTATSGPDAEFEAQWAFYGKGIKGKYVRVDNCAEAFTKLKAELVKRDIPNNFGDLFELGPSDAGQILREVCGVQKAHKWGAPDESDKDDAGETTGAGTGTATTVTPAVAAGSETAGTTTPTVAKTAGKAKVTVKGKTTKKPAAKTTKTDPQEIENEEDDSDPVAETTTGTPAVEKPAPKPKASAKKPKPTKTT